VAGSVRAFFITLLACRMPGHTGDQISQSGSQPVRQSYGPYHLAFALGLLLLALSFASGLHQLALRGELMRVHTEPWADARRSAERGGTDTAIREYLVGARVDVSGDWAWIQVGNLLRKAHRDPEAAAVYRKALEVDAGSIGAHAGLGELALDRGDTEAALRHFSTALAGQPRGAELHNSLGVAYAAARRYDDAVREFEAAIAFGHEPRFQANLDRARSERTAWAESARARP
jgi:tetratricopeptide (TPR) repeat protein